MRPPATLLYEIFMRARLQDRQALARAANRLDLANACIDVMLGMNEASQRHVDTLLAPPSVARVLAGLSLQDITELHLAKLNLLNAGVQQTGIEQAHDAHRALCERIAK